MTANQQPSAATAATTSRVTAPPGAGKLGYLTAVVKDRFFLTEDIYRYAGLIKKIIAKQGSISVNQLRDELRFGRKLTVQLMEYFDRCGFLRRKGNTHILRDGEVFDS